MLIAIGWTRPGIDARSHILSDAGYAVIPVFTSWDAYQLFLSRDIDLVILCHTVPGEERRKLIASIKKRNQRTPILCVHANGEAEDNLVDAYVHSLDGPAALISWVARLLENPRGRQISA